MKILILVLSFTDEPYLSLMRSQQASWDSVSVDGVDTLYYYGGLLAGDKVISKTTAHPANGSWSREVQFKCTDSYYYMSHKFKLALDFVKDWDYDYIFRTNSSSYVNKKKLVEQAELLPKTGLYSGWEIEGNAGYNVVSGAGFWLSRDTAEVLKDKIDPKFEREEDVYCGQLLFDSGIKIIDDKSRYDVDFICEYIPRNLYHYRCKTGDRYQDCENMRRLHKYLNP